MLRSTGFTDISSWFCVVKSIKPDGWLVSSVVFSFSCSMSSSGFNFSSMFWMRSSFFWSRFNIFRASCCVRLTVSLSSWTEVRTLLKAAMVSLLNWSSFVFLGGSKSMFDASCSIWSIAWTASSNCWLWVGCAGLKADSSSSCVANADVPSLFPHSVAAIPRYRWATVR